MCCSHRATLHSTVSLWQLGKNMERGGGVVGRGYSLKPQSSRQAVSEDLRLPVRLLGVLQEDVLQHLGEEAL